MSEFFGSAVSKLIAVFAIVMFVLMFRESILTDASVSAAFGGLMETLPFANLIVGHICKVMEFNYQIPDITAASIGTDIMKLLVMACLQPLFGRVMSMLFLRMPLSLGIDAAESFMKRPGYVIKEMLISIVTAPLLAVLSAWITTHIFDFFTNNFSALWATVLKVGSVIVAGGISLLPFLLAGAAVGTAIGWRLLITVGAGTVKTLVINTICLWMYVGLLQGVSSQVLSAIIALIVWLILADCAVNFLRRALVRVR